MIALPLATARIDADAEIVSSLVVTGSQEFHAEPRPAANHNVHDVQIKYPMLSSLITPAESMLCLGLV